MKFLVWYLGVVVHCVGLAVVWRETPAITSALFVSLGVWIFAGLIMCLVALVNLPTFIRNLAARAALRGASSVQKEGQQ